MPNKLALRIMRSGSRTFFNSARFLPSEIREDVVTLYAFVRTADDFVDARPQDAEGLIEFRSTYRRAIEGSADVPAIIADFVALQNRRGFALDWVESFLDAMESDLSIRTYATLDDTLRYVYGSAETVGLMVARIMSLDSEASHYARLLGRAFQYINFIRDVVEDLDLGRVYLPQSDVRASGLLSVSRQAIRDSPDAFCRLMRTQLARYRSWRSEADLGFRLIPSRYRTAILTAADMYDYTADVIERDPLVVLQRKVRPTGVRILIHGLANQIGVRI